MPAPVADLVLTGARIHTVHPGAPRATALAVADGRILAVGSDEEVAAHRGEATTVRELGGAFVMPGIVDAHNHHASAGKADLFELTFSAEAGYDEILEAVRAEAAGKGPDEWVIGSRWGSGLLPRLSRDAARRDLDEASGGRPVMLTDDSLHNRWVSSRALELAGVTRRSPDPDGGELVRDPESGEPTGLVLEAAGLIEDAVRRSRALSDEQFERAVARAIELAHGFGITAFQDAAIGLAGMRALKALDDRGKLDSWVVTSMAVNERIFGYPEVGDALLARRDEFRSEHHRPDFIKIFLDGTPPGRSGAFLHPYLPDAAHGDRFRGDTTMSPDELLGWLRKAAERGVSAKVHCTGDAAVRLVLDAVETLRGEGFTDTIYQIAHGQFIDPADLPRLGRLGVAAEISPFLFFPGVIADALGTVRPADELERIAPIRSLIDTGALVAGGSDWPVSAHPHAWEAIQGLVTREDPYGRRPGTLGAQEAITLAEAIEVFTINGARAMGIDDVTGSLAPGKSADFVVLDRDPFETDVRRLVETTVAETWFAGRQVFARDA